MIINMKNLYIIIISLTFLLNACSSVRDSAGVSRKSIDEFQVIENPPLVIPPDYKYSAFHFGSNVIRNGL